MVSLAENLRSSLIDTLNDENMGVLIDLTPAQIVDHAAYVIRLKDQDVSELQRRLDEAGLTEKYGTPEFEEDRECEDRMWDIAHAYFEGR
jgi:hypothetical protein